MTDETTLVTAQPDGTFEAALTVEPVRYRDGDTWDKVDTDLRAVDGRLEPKAIAGELSVSEGGPAGSVLATYSEDGSSTYSVSSPWALPRPAVSGSTATYDDVLPDVDLVVEASESGFSHNWVVKSSDAANDPRVRSLTLPTTTDGLTPSVADGGVTYRAGDGHVEGWTPTPLMWDSAGDDSETSVEAVGDGPSQGDAVAKIGVGVSDDKLTLTPDPSLLDSPAAVFPIVIDPEYSVPAGFGRSAWTAVWSNYTTKSFYNTQHSLGAGYEGFEQNKKVRSFFRFGTSVLGGKKILSAEMNVRQIHAATCSGSYPTTAYLSDGFSGSTTWNNQPSVHAAQSSNSSNIGCGSSTGPVGWDVLPGMTQTAASHSTYSTFTVRGVESNRNGWKQFDDDGTELAVRFVSYPLAPTSFSMGPQGGLNNTCVASATDANIPVFGAGAKRADGTTNPTILFKATPNSSDSLTNLLTHVEVKRVDDPTTVSANTEVYVKSGTPTSLTWSSPDMKLVDGQTYRAQVFTRSLYSDDSGEHALYSKTYRSCYFKVDTVSPAEPRVVASDGNDVCSSPGSDANGPCTDLTATTGQKISVRILPGPDEAPSQYVISQNGVPSTINAGSDGSASLDLLPKADVNQISVQAKDARNGGNLSVPLPFSYHASFPTATGMWTFDASGTSATSGGASFTLGTGTAMSSNGRHNGSLKLGSTPSVASGSVIDPMSSFSLSLWVRVSSATTSGTVLSIPGSVGSALEINYGLQGDGTPTRRWSIERTTANTASTREVLTSSVDSPTSAWTHIAVTFDSATRLTSLFVNGQVSKTATFTSAAWGTQPTMWLGCRRVNGVTNKCLDARVDDLQAFSTNIFGDQATGLANEASGPGVQIPNLVGDWSMTGPSNGPTPDSLGEDNLALDVGATVGPVSNGSSSSSLKLDGSSTSKASTPDGASVIDTSGSFSVSVWVRNTDAMRSSTIARSANESGTSPWQLRYLAPTTSSGPGQWEFSRSMSGATGADEQTVTVDASDDPSLWQHLVVVFDSFHLSDDGARRPQMVLYINGDRGGDAEFSGSPWSGSGRFVVGRGYIGGQVVSLAGEVARVQTYAGALSDTLVSQLPATFETGS